MRRSFAILIVGCVTACAQPQASSPEPQAKAPASQTSAVAFDSNRAFEHLRQQVGFGPRPAGSAALKQTRAYIAKELASYGLTVQEQAFTADTPVGKVQMVNLILKLDGRRPERILFTGHYDTKPIKTSVFVGASDGASSGAQLIEMARVLKARGPHEFTYEFVWFDGEEAFCPGWDDCKRPGNPDNTYGSRYYVEAAKKAGTLGSIKTMILFDMIGAKNLRLQRDGYSATWLNDIVWSTAKKLGHAATFVDEDTKIEDDHLAFVEAGIPCIDLIDLNDYPEWHNVQACCDDLSKVSARSLQIVGDVVLAALPDIEKRLAAR